MLYFFIFATIVIATWIIFTLAPLKSWPSAIASILIPWAIFIGFFVIPEAHQSKTNCGGAILADGTAGHGLNAGICKPGYGDSQPYSEPEPISRILTITILVIVVLSQIFAAQSVFERIRSLQNKENREAKDNLKIWAWSIISLPAVWVGIPFLMVIVGNFLYSILDQ